MVTRANGWTLLFHDCIVGQLEILAKSYTKHRNPGAKPNADAKLFAGIAKLTHQVIPIDPGDPRYRQGKTLGDARKHWFRAKFQGRFRLFFRYSTNAKIIVYAWVNDETTLRKKGGKNDPYAVFQKMLDSGVPPDDWDLLVKDCDALTEELEDALKGRP